MMKAKQISHLAEVVQNKVDKLYKELNSKESIKEIFKQSGLLNGKRIIDEYLEYNEYGIAIDHLLYMISETKIQLKNEELIRLKSLCEHLKIDLSNYDINLNIP